MEKKTLPPPPDFDSPEEAKDTIHFLWNKLAELEDRLNQNSRSSSVPSSQQPLHNKAKNTSSNRKKSGKKQRAQPGHKGHRRLLHPTKDSASVEQYLPNNTYLCGGCVIPNRKPYKRHQIFDLPDISYILVEPQVFKGKYSWYGEKHQAELPEYVPNVQMGPNLHNFISIHATQQHQSIGKIIKKPTLS
ncbi:DUF6444 domain-containing protein [Vibrio toranzoniae]|uniref:DUF6444 domain-containing protein n=1 Tax=Vibrio toranzoniae TaxID=1194427 RepID=UPI001F194C65|nr:DUF6444 domain-containing protein [Vibrio toranzoniae]